MSTSDPVEVGSSNSLSFCLSPLSLCTLRSCRSRNGAHCTQSRPHLFKWTSCAAAAAVAEREREHISRRGESSARASESPAVWAVAAAAAAATRYFRVRSTLYYNYVRLLFFSLFQCIRSPQPQSRLRKKEEKKKKVSFFFHSAVDRRLSNWLESKKNRKKK